MRGSERRHRTTRRHAASTNNGVTPQEIVEALIHIEAYAGAARAFDGYRVAREVFAETAAG
ncbi:carboxymuconolactone decarboxylase family protein [Streptomyces sp. NPDC056464]|uniref:carboxymuconolactone decarboxylase family protein n=1 Tax=Streptomyces sp. NPDC056464 TaxID=3345828 RepID=UPI003687A4F6